MLLFICILLFNCNNRKDYNIEFIKKHGNDNFDKFAQKSFTIRGNDQFGNIVIMAYDKSQDTCKAPIVFTVDKRYKQIIKI